LGKATAFPFVLQYGYMNSEDLLYLFHHIHHRNGKHETHHCGGKHPGAYYDIVHCSCGLHSIDQKTTHGDTITEDLQLKKVKLEFFEKCPDGGWHIESGKLSKEK